MVVLKTMDFVYSYTTCIAIGQWGGYCNSSSYGSELTNKFAEFPNFLFHCCIFVPVNYWEFSLNLPNFNLLCKSWQNFVVYDNNLLILGLRLLFSDGAKWKRHCKILAPAFNFDILKQCIPQYTWWFVNIPCTVVECK